MIEVCRVGEHNCRIVSRKKHTFIPHGLYTLDMLWRCMTSLMEEMFDTLYPVMFKIVRIADCTWHISCDDECVDSRLFGITQVESMRVIRDTALHDQRLGTSEVLTHEHYRHSGLRICKREGTDYIYYKSPITHGLLMWNVRTDPLRQHILHTCSNHILKSLSEYRDDSIMLMYFNSMCVAAGIHTVPDHVHADRVRERTRVHDDNSDATMLCLIILLIIICIVIIIYTRHS